MHVPVLLAASMQYLDVVPGGTYMDVTFGGGGHAAAILDRLGGSGKLVALDRDPEAIRRAEPLLSQHANLTLHQYPFSKLDEVADKSGISGTVDGILADLGTSMFQLKDASRGFSFMDDGPLDMRMNPDDDLTAADVLNHYHEPDLVRLFKEYGEERHARRIAREVVDRRKRTPFATTRQFAKMVEELAGGRRDRIHPATRCFQALRIEVNRELGELDDFLEKAWRLLKVGGRLVVISFHSLEDRVVKRYFKELSRSCICDEQAMQCTCGGENAAAKVLTRHVIRPDEAEIQANRASRSSRLRAAEKIREVAA